MNYVVYQWTLINLMGNSHIIPSTVLRSFRLPLLPCMVNVRSCKGVMHTNKWYGVNVYHCGAENIWTTFTRPKQKTHVFPVSLPTH